ncbi:MAG: hypothetical protein JJT81_10205 [Rubellimicrobium sp.]|nr:hypothetical protein [Rubellimicrobium sp.]
MLRLIKWLIYLAIFAGILLVAYAYLGPILMPDHFAPQSAPVATPVELDLD